MDSERGETRLLTSVRGIWRIQQSNESIIPPASIAVHGAYASMRSRLGFLQGISSMERNASQLAAVQLENESGHQSWEVVLQDNPNHGDLHYSINNSPIHSSPLFIGLEKWQQRKCLALENCLPRNLEMHYGVLC